MTTYHVWLTGREAPERIEALGVYEESPGVLVFMGEPGRDYGHAPAINGPMIPYSVRLRLHPEQWRQWSVVHDEADHLHI